MSKKFLVPFIAALFIIGALKLVDARLYNPQTATSGGLTIGGNLTVQGTGTSTFSSNIAPNANNTLDLGSFESAWRNIIASGTLRINDLVIATSGIIGQPFTYTNANSGGDQTWSGKVLVSTINKPCGITIVPRSPNVAGAVAGTSTVTNNLVGQNSFIEWWVQSFIMLTDGSNVATTFAPTFYATTSTGAFSLSYYTRNTEIAQVGTTTVAWCVHNGL